MRTHLSGPGLVPFDVGRVRNDFPILTREVNHEPLVYLDNAASSQKPLHVLEEMDAFYRLYNANVHRGVHTLSQEATDRFETARRTVASFIGATDDAEVIFTRGTTESINLVAYSFGLSQLQPGDMVLLSGMEHHSNIVPWQIVCAMRGASIRVIPVLSDGTLDMDAFDQLLDEKVRLISVAHISNALGTINPVSEIIQKAHALGIPVMLDGAQAVPHMEVNVAQLDADFYAFSSHKMYGPTGIGILYGKRSWLDILPPWQGGGEMIQDVKWTGTTYNELPFKYEAGTPDIAGAIGLAAACDYILSFDREAIQQHEDRLLRYCTEKLESLPGVRTIGTSRSKAPVYSFVVDGLHPYDIGTILDQQGIAVRTGHHCAQPLMDHFQISGTIRASFALYNSLEEIDKLVRATQKAIKILS